MQAAVLRTVYVDQNTKDLRFEVFIDKWWSANLAETVAIPAGTVIKSRNGTSLLDTNQTIPVDLLFKFRNSEAEKRARLGKLLMYSTFSNLPMHDLQFSILDVLQSLECSTKQLPTWSSRSSLLCKAVPNWHNVFNAAPPTFALKTQRQHLNMVDFRLPLSLPMLLS